MTKPDNLPLLVFPHFPARALAERDIITRAIHGLLAAGYKLNVYDQDEDTGILPEPTTDAQKIANELWQCDEDWLNVYPANGDDRLGWVYLVYGNDGADVVSDYTTNLEAALKDANERAQELLG